MKSISQWKKYFVYFCLLLMFFLIIDFQTYKLITIRSRIEIPFYPWTLMGIKFLTGFIFGALLGMEQFSSEFKKIGKWNVNFPKLVFLVLPAVLFSFADVIYFLFSIPTIDILSRIIGPMMYPNNPTIMLFQILLGYSLITCFYKEDLSYNRSSLPFE